MTRLQKLQLPTVIKALRKMAAKGPRDTKFGICTELTKEYDIRLPRMPHYGRIMSRWKQYSGDPIYPVPHPKHRPECGYWGEHNLWIGKYGASRRAYARYLAREFSKLLK